MIPQSTAAYEAACEITEQNEKLEVTVVSCEPLGEGFQPLLSPDDCDLAERIVKLDAGVAKLLEERYNITDIGETLDREGWRNYHRRFCRRCRDATFRLVAQAMKSTM